MKNLRLIVIVIILPFLFCGCAGFKLEVAKIETELKSVNWTEVASYWSKFVKGLNEAIPVIEALFPGTKSTLDNVVKPVVAQANVAATDLTNTVEAYQAGTLTAVQVQASAKEAQAAVMAASDLVSQAMKGKVATAPITSVPAPVPAAPTK